MSNNHLPDCPNSPNCVSSQASAEGQRVAPLRFEGSPAAAWERLREILENMPRTRIVEDDGHRLKAEVQSLICRFVDDVEFALEAAERRIEMRSASRSGYWDLGVNRRRADRIRKAFQESASNGEST